MYYLIILCAVISSVWSIEFNPNSKGCGPNEVNVTCPTSCPATCVNPNPGVCINKRCTPYGCVCKEGFIRQYLGGPCIRRNACRGNCGPHQVNVTCPNPCPPTCEKPNPVPCRALCLQYGCTCQEGYIRKFAGGPCVPKCSCGKGCGPFEVSTQCNVPNQPTCAEPNRTPGKPIACGKPDCICKKGYIRETDGGKCIPREDCPGCGPNEIITPSGFDCITCQNRKFVRCIAINETKCRCKEGFIRSYGECISDNECLQDDQCRDAEPNSMFYTACVPCPTACPGQEPYICPAFCRPGCGCKQGYVVNRNTGRCVLPNECPPT